jgi:deoxyribodipyrimidine photo-lyase
MNVFWFRRDFRLMDNISLNALAQHKKPITCIFIFTPTQLKNNPFFSERSFQFMCESLMELRGILRKRGGDLSFFYGEPLDIFKGLTINTLAFNKDYTPYSLERDKKVQQYCIDNKIECLMEDDILLDKMGTVVKNNGEPYVVFTAFKNKVSVPKRPHTINATFVAFPSSYEPSYSQHDQLRGGRKNGLNHLKREFTREMLTPMELSPYLKYGCVSIREAYWSKEDDDFRRQLIWRDFFYYLTFYFPRVLKERSSFKPDPIKWVDDPVAWKKWKEGNTGEELVDASMRQLNQTGFMTNRGRLVTANYLTRTLQIDWRKGELYFARNLIDYDPAINNGNWQWAAGTGADRAPYSQRIMKPSLQLKKHDPLRNFIHTWIDPKTVI